MKEERNKNSDTSEQQQPADAGSALATRMHVLHIWADDQSDAEERQARQSQGLSSLLVYGLEQKKRAAAGRPGDRQTTVCENARFPAEYSHVVVCCVPAEWESYPLPVAT